MAFPKGKTEDLRFHGGKFRIMQVADIQDTQATSRDTLQFLAAALDKARPDLVVFTGDQFKGYGVSFLGRGETGTGLEALIRQIPCDLVIQRPVRQHPALSRLHPESVNTLRIVSLLTGERVKIYAVCLKIGVGKERVDNGCHGGIYCGVRPDGRLRPLGITDSGRTIRRHPQLGYRFEEQRVPCLKNALELVRRAHPFLGHFRLISWDVAIDENGEDLSLGGITDVQLCSGPLFGRDTKMVLDVVFAGRRRNWCTWFSPADAAGRVLPRFAADPQQ